MAHLRGHQLQLILKCPVAGEPRAHPFEEPGGRLWLAAEPENLRAGRRDHRRLVIALAAEFLDNRAGPPLAHLDAPRQERLGLGLLQPDPRHHLLIDRLQTLLILGSLLISGQKRTALQSPIP